MNNTLHIISAVLGAAIMLFFNLRPDKNNGEKSQINLIGVILQVAVWGSFVSALIYIALEKIFA